jgi:cellulose biosynthesis protein BcsQ
VGKTTISGNVADTIARMGHKTILVDCDPQGNATSWLHPEKLEKDIAHVLSGDAEVADVICEIAPNLFLLPAIAIGGNLKKWSETELNENPKAFEFLNEDIAKMGFDYAIYDCSPSFSLLERTILADVDEVINPLTPEFFSIDGIETFTYELGKIEKAHRRKITNNKIVVNMMNRSFVRHKEFHKELGKLNYQIFTIPQDSKVAEGQIAHQAVYRFTRSARAIPEFEAIAQVLVT